MKEKIKIGVVPLVRSTYDVKEGNRIYTAQIKRLRNMQDVDWVAFEKGIEDENEFPDVLKTLYGVDGVILVSNTFHLGTFVSKLLSEFPNIPILIWALPEPAYNGGRIRINSLVGAHLDGSNIYKMGHDNFEFFYGTMEEDHFSEKLNQWLDALRIVKKWKNAKIGLIGAHAKSFFNIDVYEPALYSDIGGEIEYVSLESVFNSRIEEEFIDKEAEEIRKIYSFGENMDEARLKKVAKLSLTFEKMVNDSKFDAMAIRCWPEFASVYGISPCAAMSKFMVKHIPIACEGDIEGSLGMMAYKSIGCNEVFLADVSQIIDENDLLLWHCGVAPYNTWDGKSEKTLDTYFANGHGVTVGFVLKTGPVTIMRVDYARGKWRIFLQEGEVVPMEKELKGTYARVKVKSSIDVVEKLIKNGFAHHVVLGYGNYSEVIKELAKIKNWEVVE
ncbi:MAG: L-fucose/L-arabinose isomerase family protein [Athalassotoga sp.]